MVVSMRRNSLALLALLTGCGAAPLQHRSESDHRARNALHCGIGVWLASITALLDHATAPALMNSTPSVNCITPNDVEACARVGLTCVATCEVAE